MKDKLVIKSFIFAVIQYIYMKVQILAFFAQTITNYQILFSLFQHQNSTRLQLLPETCLSASSVISFISFPYTHSPVVSRAFTLMYTLLPKIPRKSTLVPETPYFPCFVYISKFNWPIIIDPFSLDYSS